MDPLFEIDLHGRRPEAAEAFLGQQLHAARVRGERQVRVITGRGWGNPDWKPVLRDRIRTWLLSPEGRRRGVKDVQVSSNGGALEVRLG